MFADHCSVCAFWSNSNVASLAASLAEPLDALRSPAARCVRCFELLGALPDARLEFRVQRVELPALPVKLDKDLDFRLQDFRNHRDRHVVDRAGAVSLQQIIRFQTHGGDEDDRGLLVPRMIWMIAASSKPSRSGMQTSMRMTAMCVLRSAVRASPAVVALMSVASRPSRIASYVSSFPGWSSTRRILTGSIETDQQPCFPPLPMQPHAKRCEISCWVSTGFAK